MCYAQILFCVIYRLNITQDSYYPKPITNPIKAFKVSKSKGRSPDTAIMDIGIIKDIRIKDIWSMKKDFLLILFLYFGWTYLEIKKPRIE